MDSTTTNQPLAIEARGLRRRYGGAEALAGLDLEVASADCFALLGPNGAGKTTAVHILATLLAPTGGSARVFGRDVTRERNALREQIGIVFQEPSLDPQLTPREHLALSARLYRIPARTQRVAELLEGFGLGDHANHPVRTLSGGLRRRLEIARGILHAPPLLFLDEPTVGLDVAARAGVWERLRSLRAARTTLFLTTHSMEEADALADQVGILDRGRLVARGSPRALKASLGGDSIWLRVEHRDEALAVLGKVGEVVSVRPDPDAADALYVTAHDGPRRLAGVIEAARPYGVIEVELHRPSLEQVFLHHTGRRYAEPEVETAQ